MNTQNYLATSALAYEKLTVNTEVNGSDGVKYRVVKAMHHPSGYDGYIFYRKDTKELIVAHRGTWPEKGALTQDVLTDLNMAVNDVNKQYKHAEILTKEAIKLSKNGPYKGAEIRQTGHSLGGTIGQLCGYNYDQKTETFNAYGAADLTRHLKSGTSKSEIINHVRGTDPVSAASTHLGTVKHYLNREELVLLQGGGYGNKLLPNLTWGVALTGVVYDHGLKNFQNGGLSSKDLNLANKNQNLINEFRGEFLKEAKEKGARIKEIQDEIQNDLQNINKNLQNLKKKVSNTLENSINELIDRVDRFKNRLSVSDNLNIPEDKLAPTILAAEANGSLSPIKQDNPKHSSADQIAHTPQSKYNELRTMLHGLINDTDGSYAKKVIAEHPEISARFDEKARQRIEQEEIKQQELAVKDNHSLQQEEQQRSFSRSFG